MSENSIPSEQGAEGTLRHLLKDKYRRAQDAHLDLILRQLWDDGVLGQYRALAAFQDIHRRLRDRHEQFMAAYLAADSLHPVVRGPNYFVEYTALVLAMARAGDDRPFIPVELWPQVPPPHPYTAEAQMALQAILKMIDGFLPLHDFQAPGKASGKSLTAELMILPFAGRSYPRRVFPENEEERAKTALSFLKKGRPFLWFENKSGFIESDVLDVLLTTPVFSGRELGHSVDLEIPVRCSFVMTSNNPSFEEQVSRRRVRTRLDTGLEQPQLRDPSQFRYPDIVGWAAAHRGELIWACLTLIRAWIVAGKPMSTRRKPFGTFQQWADTMGALLDYVGIPGLIENMEEALRLDDVLGDVWRRFVAEWARLYPQHPVVTTKELYPITLGIEDFPWGKAQDERQQKAALTRQLRAKKDRPIGGYKITIATNEKGKEVTTGGLVHFQLVPLDPPNGPQERELKSEGGGNDAKRLEVVGGSWRFSDDPVGGPKPCSGPTSPAEPAPKAAPMPDGAGDAPEESQNASVGPQESSENLPLPPTISHFTAQSRPTLLFNSQECDEIREGWDRWPAQYITSDAALREVLPALQAARVVFLDAETYAPKEAVEADLAEWVAGAEERLAQKRAEKIRQG